jgi:hypothetical protein
MFAPTVRFPPLAAIKTDIDVIGPKPPFTTVDTSGGF